MDLESIKSIKSIKTVKGKGSGTEHDERHGTQHLAFAICHGKCFFIDTVDTFEIHK